MELNNSYSKLEYNMLYFNYMAKPPRARRPGNGSEVKSQMAVGANRINGTLPELLFTFSGTLKGTFGGQPHGSEKRINGTLAFSGFKINHKIKLNKENYHVKSNHVFYRRKLQFG
jgi:hypothetical protein